MSEKKTKITGGHGLFSKKDYKIGDIILSESEWYSDLTDDWITLTITEILNLSEADRDAFLTYSFDIGFGLTKGTFHEKALINPANFINHSCNPNTEFDGEDNIRAKRDIRAGEELFIDYGSFVVNFDQTFLCTCGESNCRKWIRKDDWKRLSNETRSNLAKFIRESQV